MTQVAPSARPRPSLALLAGLLVVAGCASNADLKPAICDGRHRRPANPYGSVIPITPDAASPLAAPAPPASSPPAAVTPAPVTPKPQARLDPRSLLPCGGHA